MKTKIKLNAMRMQKKVVRHTDDTGKKLPKEMIDRQNASPFRGRVTIEMVTEEIALVQFNVVVIESKNELVAFIADQDEAGRPVFQLSEGIAECAKGMALECLKRNLMDMGGHPLLSVEL